MLLSNAVANPIINDPSLVCRSRLVIVMKTP